MADNALTRFRRVRGLPSPPPGSLTSHATLLTLHTAGATLLQGYEATRYHAVRFRLLLEIAKALAVDLAETVRLTPSACGETGYAPAPPHQAEHIETTAHRKGCFRKL